MGDRDGAKKLVKSVLIVVLSIQSETSWGEWVGGGEGEDSVFYFFHLLQTEKSPLSQKINKSFSHFLLISSLIQLVS